MAAAQFPEPAGGEHSGLGCPVAAGQRGGQALGVGGPPVLVVLPADEERPHDVDQLPGESRESVPPGAAHRGHQGEPLGLQPGQRRLAVPVQLRPGHRIRPQVPWQRAVVRIEDLLRPGRAEEVVVEHPPQDGRAHLGRILLGQ